MIDTIQEHLQQQFEDWNNLHNASQKLLSLAQEHEGKEFQAEYFEELKNLPGVQSVKTDQKGGIIKVEVQKRQSYFPYVLEVCFWEGKDHFRCFVDGEDASQEEEEENTTITPEKVKNDLPPCHDPTWQKIFQVAQDMLSNPEKIRTLAQKIAATLEARKKIRELTENIPYGFELEEALHLPQYQFTKL